MDVQVYMYMQYLALHKYYYIIGNIGSAKKTKINFDLPPQEA